MKLMSIILLSAVAVALGAGAAGAEQHGNSDRPDHESRAHAAPSHVSAAKAARAKASGDFDVGHLIDAIRKAQADLKGKLSQHLNADGLDTLSIRDMFEMEMLKNHFSQISDMPTNVVSPSNAAIAGMARNFRN
jgi:hypothetical protein